MSPHQDPLPAWLLGLYAQVTAWNSHAYLSWLPVTSPTARSSWSPCYFPQIANSFLCCAFARDVLGPISQWPSAQCLSPSQALGHILPPPFLRLLCTIRPITASEPSPSVGTRWCGTEQVIFVVGLYFFGRLKSLRTEFRLQVSWYFSCMGLSIEPEAGCTVGAHVDFSTTPCLEIALVLKPIFFIHSCILGT